MGRFIGLDLLETMIDGLQIRRKKIESQNRREKKRKTREEKDR
jgi:hypothetical protein